MNMDSKTFTEKYYIDRSKQNTVKWQRGRKLKALPLWVADMDFKDDERVIEKLEEFIRFGDYGYNNLPEDYYKVYNNYQLERNGITYKQEHIRFTRGAVDALHQLVCALTEKGDAILINTPLYPPFKGTISSTKRKVVESKMINENGHFVLNYKDIEKKIIRNKVKMLMLCSPHNPLGRVFSKEELEKLFALCKKNKVIIVADEVHGDIIMKGHSFTPALSLKKYQNNIISINAVSKTFSLAVYSHCHVVIPNNSLRKKFIAYQQSIHAGSVNAFNALASYYNFQYGKEWLDSVNELIYENYCYFKDKLSAYLKMCDLEGSYLLFVDLAPYCGEISGADFLLEKCHLLVNPGESFDPDYRSWVRINLATSPANIRKAVKTILKQIKENSL